MVKLNLENVDALITSEGDWTVRLLNKSVPPPSKYIFSILRLDGGSGLWIARFLSQNLIAVFEESNTEFTEAKRILFREITNYLSKGYEITAVTSAYYIPPWLQRKR